MALLSFIVLASTLALVCFADDPIEVDTANCRLKGGDGTYSYDPTSGKGPDDWGKIEEFKTCDAGKVQSPIDFPLNVKYAPFADGPKPFLAGNEFKLGSGPSNWGLTCKKEKSCGYTMFNGKKYYLMSMHFHAPSEHHLNGISYPLESHFVGATKDGELAVIATMYKYPDDEGYAGQIYKQNKQDFGTNGFIKTVLSGINSNKKSFTVYPGSVIESTQGYCTYEGSLTTPPCTEGVTFLMAMHVETVSRRQVHGYSVSAGASFDGNNRPLQVINGRNVTCYV